MNEPILSVIVPIYMADKYLPNCIDSILDQSFKDFELILVNDGSKDNSESICIEYSKKDSRIRLISKQNGGVSSARNAGIEIAKGRYISFIDPDDVIEKNMFQDLIKKAVTVNADIVVCPIKTINLITNSTSVSSIYEKDVILDQMVIRKKIIPSILNKQFYSLLSSCNKLYKKSLFEKVKFDEKKSHGEDARLNIILLTYIKSLVFVEHPYYKYYIRKRDSLTRKFREDFYEYILDNKNFGLELCEQYGESRMKEHLLSVYIRDTINFIERVVTSKITYFKKSSLIKKILKDYDFIVNLYSYDPPSIYYRLLKFLCIKKWEKTLYTVIKIKNIVQNLGIGSYRL